MEAGCRLEIITEQGIADLRGLSPVERATEIIENCAHPDYRDGLEGYLEQASRRSGHIPVDLDAAYRWQD